MEIEIFGTGCINCKKLETNVKKAIAEAGVKPRVKMVRDVNEIMSRGIVFTPALVIDGELKAMGRVPPVSEIIRMLG